jgi:hypothetical protein
MRLRCSRQLSQPPPPPLMPLPACMQTGQATVSTTHPRVHALCRQLLRCRHASICASAARAPCRSRRRRLCHRRRRHSHAHRQGDYQHSALTYRACTWAAATPPPRFARRLRCSRLLSQLPLPPPPPLPPPSSPLACTQARRLSAQRTHTPSIDNCCSAATLRHAARASCCSRCRRRRRHRASRCRRCCRGQQCRRHPACLPLSRWPRPGRPVSQNAPASRQTDAFTFDWLQLQQHKCTLSHATAVRPRQTAAAAMRPAVTTNNTAATTVAAGVTTASYALHS